MYLCIGVTYIKKDDESAFLKGATVYRHPLVRHTLLITWPDQLTCPTHDRTLGGGHLRLENCKTITSDHWHKNRGLALNLGVSCEFTHLNIRTLPWERGVRLHT